MNQTGVASTGSRRQARRKRSFTSANASAVRGLDRRVERCARARGPATGTRPRTATAAAGRPRRASRGRTARRPRGPTPMASAASMRRRSPEERRSAASRRGDTATRAPAARGGVRSPAASRAPALLQPQVALRRRARRVSRSRRPSRAGGRTASRPGTRARSGATSAISSARPPYAPIGMPPPMILPSTVRSGRTPKRACAPPRPTRNPVITSSKISSAPSARRQVARGPRGSRAPAG